MNFIYIDESGDPNYSRKGTPTGSSEYFIRAGVIIPKNDWFQINSKIKKFRADEGIPADVEIHATEVVRGSFKESVRQPDGSSKKITKANFFGKKYPKPSDRVLLIERYIQSIIVANKIQIVAVVICKNNIDPKQFVPSNIDHGLKNRSLTFLSEKINHYLTNSKTKGLMMFDQVDLIDDSRHRKYQKHLYKHSDFIKNSNFIETMCFAPSHESEFLQMADVVSNSLFKHMISGSYSPYKLLEPQIFNKKFWPEKKTT